MVRRLSLLLLLAAACETVPKGEPPRPRPLGYAGKEVDAKQDAVERYLDDYGYDDSDFEPAPDRWRGPLRRWDRTPVASENLTYTDSPYAIGWIANPYRQNVLKGDYPLFGQNTFFNFTAAWDTVIEARDLPTPAGISTARPDTPGFFGRGEQGFLSSNLILSFEIFEGNTAFKPPDYLIRITPVFNLTYLTVEENNNVNIDVREGTTRTDTWIGFQELFFEKHLLDLSPNYDFLTMTVGIQRFVSDFRGLLFFDNNLGLRFTANFDNNRTQANLAGFYMLEKDTNSDLNTFDARDQIVVAATLTRQDLFFLGYNGQLSFNYNHDGDSPEVDRNGVPVRPPILGDATAHTLDVFYVGFAGDGHLGRVNVTHEYFYAFGRDTDNPIAGRSTDIAAQMFFLELSVDIDWWRPRFSFLWASGDDNPYDSDARGFDSILDNPNFAGGLNSYWIRQNLRLLGVGLNQRFSAFPDLRSAKFQGQANFVNPGIFFWNVGIDAELTQELRASLNASYLRFAETGSLEPFINQNDLDDEIGYELTLSGVWRPNLTNNVQLAAGASVLFPGAGFRQIYESGRALYSLFLQVSLVY